MSDTTGTVLQVLIGLLSLIVGIASMIVAIASLREMRRAQSPNYARDAREPVPAATEPRDQPAPYRGREPAVFSPRPPQPPDWWPLRQAPVLWHILVAAAVASLVFNVLLPHSDTAVLIRSSILVALSIIFYLVLQVRRIQTGRNSLLMSLLAGLLAYIAAVDTIDVYVSGEWPAGLLIVSAAAFLIWRVAGGRKATTS